MELRNVAIIAHVDHGKTTLVDSLLKQSNTFRVNSEESKQELIMDSNELEKERGITILAKNTAITYKDVKINIIDTPGHADFGGEVERTLHMADGCLLVVDAQEGPMPQTRTVLRQAIQMKLKVIVVINKIDKKFARPKEVIEEIHDLFLDLVTDDAQLDFPVLYAVGRLGTAFYEMPEGDPETLSGTIVPILDTILKVVPAPKTDAVGGFQLLATTLDYDSYKGKYVIGRVQRGSVKPGLAVSIIDKDNKKISARIEKVFVSQGLQREEVAEASAGEIVALTGLGDAHISDTIADQKQPEALPRIAIQEPTLKIVMGPNTSPFGGQDGKFLTSRQIQERLERELESNVSMRMEINSAGKFLVSGRGELHLSVLIETMRREGYEIEVGKPEVIVKEVDGKQVEPVEEVTIDAPKEYSGVISAELSRRRAKSIDLFPHADGLRFIYELPTRNLLGLRSYLLIATRAGSVLNSSFLRYEPTVEALPKSRSGVLIASESGMAVANGLEVAQGRGVTFVAPQTPVYEGMVIGENSRGEDIEINVSKAKQLNNFRTAGHEYAIQLAPPRIMSLEECLDFIESDELLEVTPKHLRLRKKHLKRTDRARYK